MSSRWVTAVLFLAGAGLTVLSYSPGIEAGFYLDDAPNIVQATVVHWTELSVGGFKELVDSAQIPRRLVANSTFALNHLIGGLEPRGYHWVNLWIHLLVGLSLAWLTWLYGRQGDRPEARQTAPLVAAVVSVLFMLHPLNIQAVTYIVQRMSSLAALFSLWSLALYLLARHARTAVRMAGLYSLSIIAWALALGSKENALSLPFVILLFEACFHGPEWRGRIRGWMAGRRRWALLAGIAALLLAGGVIYTTYIGSSPLRWTDPLPGRDFSGWERVLTQSRVQLFYLGLLLWPAPSSLNLDHDFTVSRSLMSPPSTAAAMAFWLAVLVAAVTLARRRPRYGFPILAYLLLHAIEAGPISLELVFEHRMYLPMTALALLATALLVDLAPRSRKIVLALALVATVPLAIANHRRNTVWSDQIGFHYDSARKSPEKFRPQLNLGTQLGKAGRYAEAVPFLRKAVELRPDEAKAHNQLGTAYLRLRRLDEALPEFHRAIILDPDHAYAHYNIAWILDRSGRSQEALPFYHRFLALAPEKLAEFRAPVARRIRELSRARGTADG